jgi:hypothetical protein
MGVKVFSNDSTEALQDLTIGLTRFDLAKVLSVIPYAPNVSGVMNGDFHYINSESDMSVSSSVRVDNLSYDGCKIGNVASEFIYMPRDEGNEHCVDGTLSIDDQEVCTLSGTYITSGFGHLNADIELQRTPLLMLNGFIPDRLLNFGGYAVGRVKVNGQLDRLDNYKTYNNVDNYNNYKTYNNIDNYNNYKTYNNVDNHDNYKTYNNVDNYKTYKNINNYNNINNYDNYKTYNNIDNHKYLNDNKTGNNYNNYCRYRKRRIYNYSNHGNYICFFDIYDKFTFDYIKINDYKGSHNI